MRARFAVLLLALCSAPGLAAAQLRPEARVGAAFPTSDDFDGIATNGIAAEVTLAYPVLPFFEVYGGGSWARFDFDDETGTFDANYTDLGLSAGGRVLVPATPRVRPWVRGGLIFNSLAAKGQNEDGFINTIESDWSLGYEVGGGLMVVAGAGFLVTPGVRYRSYTATLDFGVEAEATIQYLVVDLGVRLPI